ncbi:hypothetical protein H920_02016 [Fukomys damarensis]|uniref:Uncharacterized protein n=1 Tax=Fukomys damarensis TaxID=885580 RepID=A0A091DZP7_FUKDA|nr:hypothetical protein H920_02016 [Fukomys damarensis]
MVFLMRTWLFSWSLEEELRASLSLVMAAVLVKGALIFTVSITPWLQCRSLTLVAQILHPWNRISGFHHYPLGLPGADPRYRQAWVIAMGSRLLPGLMENIALDSRSSTGLVWDIAVGSRLLAGFFGSLDFLYSSAFDMLGDYYKRIL